MKDIWGLCPQFEQASGCPAGDTLPGVVLGNRAA